MALGHAFRQVCFDNTLKAAPLCILPACGHSHRPAPQHHLFAPFVMVPLLSCLPSLQDLERQLRDNAAAAAEGRAAQESAVQLRHR